MVVESSENKQWDKYPTLKIIFTCYQLLIVAVMAAVGSCFVVGIGFITSKTVLVHGLLQFLLLVALLLLSLYMLLLKE